MTVFNQAKSTPYLPPGPLPFPQFICVHEVTKPTKHGTSVKTYAYAWINADETCPPFTSQYEIPENEIGYTGDVIWDELEEEVSHVICPTLPSTCTEFNSELGLNTAEMQACVFAIEACYVADTGHDCRPGLLDNH
ncbi:MAG: hypothetical protein ACSHWU_01665 [Marinicella sp.]